MIVVGCQCAGLLPKNMFDSVLPECLWSQDATWNGSKMNAEAASDIFGADDVYPLSEVRTRLHLCDDPSRAWPSLQCRASCNRQDAEVESGSDARVPTQMEQHLESMVSHASRVFYDQGSERMTHPCAPVKLHAAMHVALQQRRIEPLRSIIHPMR